MVNHSINKQVHRKALTLEADEKEGDKRAANIWKNAAASSESHEKRGRDCCRTPNGRETSRISGKH